jgi:gliding motility-associated-like protein
VRFSVKWLVIFILTLLSVSQLAATHLVGGYLTYRFIGTNGSSSQYRVTLYVYRDCINDNTDNEVPFDKQITLCIYNSNRSYFDNRTINLVRSTKVDPVGNTTCPEVKSACLDQGIYETTVTLPNNSTGYHLKWERCCRNTQNNLRDDNAGTPYQGQTYYGFIPASSLKNSSPVFQDMPIPFMCVNDTTTIRNRTIDPDGDSLSYRFVTPWQGASGATPIFDNCPSVMTSFQNVEYKSGFNAMAPFGSGGIAQIDAFNGLTTYLSRTTGRFAVAIEVTEWRNKIPISTIRQDLQILVINCKPNSKPRLGYEGGSKTWYVEAGEQICRNVTATDDDIRDVVTLRAFGDIFTGSNGFTGTKATITPAPSSGVKTTTARFCWKTDCNHARTEPYRVTFEAYDNGCPSKFINENVLIYVRPFTPTETPTGPIQVCQNSKGVRYNATSPGSGNTYLWRVTGGVIQGDSTQNSVFIDWGSGTSGKLELFIISKFGCRVGPRILNISLAAAPAKPDITGSDTVCLNSTSAFIVSVGSGITYQWTVSGGNILGNSDQPTLNVRWNTQGRGWVSLILQNAQGCRSLPDTHFVFVSFPNTPPLTGPTSVCPNNPNIEYSVFPPTPGSVYQWNVSGGIESSGTMSSAILVNWGGKGIGFVNVQEVNRFGCVGDTVKIRIVKGYALEGQLPQGDTSLCAFSRNEEYSINPVNGETYLWTVTGGTIISGQNTAKIVVNWGATGTGSVGVQATAYDSVVGLPCISPVRARIVNLWPYPNTIPINGNFDFCQTRTQVQFSLAGFAGSTYAWELNGIAFTGQGSNRISISGDTFGTFTVRVRETSPFGCIGQWIDTQLVIHPRPRTTAITGKDVICYPRLTGYTYSVNGFAGSNYSWGNTGGVFNPLPALTDAAVRIDWSGQQNNRLWVVETSSFGCVGDTVRQNVFIDNPTVFSRLVTVNPPPGEDKPVQVYYTLLNAPRYNNTVIIQRKNRGGSAFGTIGTANPNDSVYEDKTAIPDSLSYEYRAVIVNLCGDSIYSNTNTDILLRGAKTGPFSMSLNFTDYLGWPNGVERYELYRLLENKAGYSFYGTYFSPQSATFDNGKDHYGQYFRIKAIENGPSKRESWSNDIRIFYEPVIYIPNAFSPDANGLNEKFIPAAGGLKTYKLTIFNRWGEKLFSTANSETGWDGNYLGKPCPSGVYIYVCEYTDFRDKPYTTKGTLHLLR